MNRNVPEQPDLFTAATEARDAGMAQAADHAGESWSAYAFAFLCNYCRIHPTLFVDDLWSAGLDDPVSPRALGPVFVRAAREQIIIKTGEHRPSVRSRLGPKPVWRSLIYGGTR